MTHAISRSQNFYVLGFPSRGCPLRRKRVQRYDLFPNRQKYFSLFPKKFPQHAVINRNKNKTFFSVRRKNAPQNGPRGGFLWQNRVSAGQPARAFSRISLVYTIVTAIHNTYELSQNSHFQSDSKSTHPHTQGTPRHRRAPRENPG